MTNLWQLILALRDQEEQKKREMMAKLFGQSHRWQGMSDSGYSLEQLFRGRYPELSNENDAYADPSNLKMELLPNTNLKKSPFRGYL